MLRYLLATTTILIGFGGAGLAQDAAGTATSDQPEATEAAGQPDSAAGAPDELETAATTDMATTPAAGGAVDPALVRELRLMVLEAEKAAAKPTPPKSEEAVAAEKQALERHRTDLFARVEERSAEADDAGN